MSFLQGTSLWIRRGMGGSSKYLTRPLASTSTQILAVTSRPNSTTRSPKPPLRRIRGVPADQGGLEFEDIVEARVVRPPQLNKALDNDFTEGIDQTSLALALDEFARRPIVRQLAADHGLGQKLFIKAFYSFKQYCVAQNAVLEPALLVTFHDIIKRNHDVDRLYEFFLNHAKKVFPHIEAMNELKMISDLTQPHNWYPDARTIQRKIIFHAGPTNSGKTHNALKRFREAKSGVYCGPLKLLAAEAFIRTNELGVKCDMVTGEERRFAVDSFHPSTHLSSTVEMLSTTMRVEVAVIDEIQMLRDEQRGWAWTRALLGVAADEVHLCGEPAAIDMVRKLIEPIGETVEVFEYERKSPLNISKEGLRSFDRVEPGDAIVCFSKKVIYSITRQLEKLGIKPAVIYGDLPPGAKLSQAARFNDPDDPCNVLVSTDAIGMGLNLNIKRVVFAGLTRRSELIPNYQALQIGGRAGRFGTQYAEGVVTTFRQEDIGTLRDILGKPVPPIEIVGISPTYEQIETFSFHLPQASFVTLLDLFVSVCSVSDHFFICSTVKQMRHFAELIDRVALPLKVRYTFCICPLNVEDKKKEAAFVKMANRFSSGQLLTYDWMMDTVMGCEEWPPAIPKTLAELEELEDLYEIIDTYLWLSLRFPDMMPDEEAMRTANGQLDKVIQVGVENIVDLFAAQGKEGSEQAKLREKQQTAKDKEEWEKLQKEQADVNDLKLPSKRKGKRRSILDKARGVLTEEELKILKEALGKDDDEK
ncbi:unnamed protein product, partial [Mesorhabditis belari]|uniref:ATP-dependent RNA helicase SUV3 homolog, mitochondrial n=1 Tax=Mesorhabditis belari TaxID=2138241 RepID=A0AAF3EW41_9BILA